MFSQTEERQSLSTMVLQTSESYYQYNNGLILSLKPNSKPTFPMLDTTRPFLYLTFLSNLDLTTLLTHLNFWHQ